MDEQEFKNLIKDKPADQQKKGVLLYNGMIKSANVYQAESTKVNLLNWKAAEAAFDKFISKLNSADNTAVSDKPAFKSRVEVLKYLWTQGAKVSRGKLYNDAESGKLRIQADGSVLLSDVDIYVMAYLKAGKKGGMAPEIENLNKEKLNEEIKKLKEQNKKLAWEREKETGKYILRDDFEMEIVSRAVVLDVSLKQMISSKALNYISMCKGDFAQTAEVIREMTADINNVLNDYATTEKFQVFYANHNNK